MTKVRRRKVKLRERRKSSILSRRKIEGVEKRFFGSGQPIGRHAGGPFHATPRHSRVDLKILKYSDLCTKRSVMARRGDLDPRRDLRDQPVTVERGKKGHVPRIGPQQEGDTRHRRKMGMEMFYPQSARKRPNLPLARKP